MIFKDRKDAARKLLSLIKKSPEIKRFKPIIVSLLRGGIVLGALITTELNTQHLPLVVTKIPSPHNPELAIGAICFDVTYLEKRVVQFLGLKKKEISAQIKIAEHKFIQYCQWFSLKENLYKSLKNKVVILVDDGVATGASVKAALLFLKSKKPKKIILAVPVASTDFEIKGVKQYVLHRDPNFTSVSQFYRNFPQVEDREVKKLLYNQTIR